MARGEGAWWPATNKGRPVGSLTLPSRSPRWVGEAGKDWLSGVTRELYIMSGTRENHCGKYKRISCPVEQGTVALTPKEPRGGCPPTERDELDALPRRAPAYTSR